MPINDHLRSTAIDNTQAADRFVEAACRAFQQLALTPGMGRRRVYPLSRLPPTYRAVHWTDYTARTASRIFSLAPRRRSGERVGVRGCLLSPILRTPQYVGVCERHLTFDTILFL